MVLVHYYIILLYMNHKALIKSSSSQHADVCDCFLFITVASVISGTMFYSVSKKLPLLDIFMISRL